MRFIRDFNGWELDLVTAFLNSLESNTPIREGNDKICWRLKRSGGFDVGSYYYALRGACILTYPWKIIWSVKPLVESLFFGWTVAWEKILAHEHLIKCGYTLVEWCCICRCKGRRLIIRCYTILLHLNCGVVHSDLLESMAVTGNAHWFGKHSLEIWNLFPVCIMWTIVGNKIVVLLRTQKQHEYFW